MISMLRPGGDAASRAAWYGVAVLILTSLHHAYGAYVYDTPWRLHAVYVAAAAALAILGARAVMRAETSPASRKVARAIFVVVTLGVAVLMFGFFEGGYNHAVKNVLYFGGAPPALMAQLFPPPAYELPNDLFFELTGILQAVPAVLAAAWLYRMVREPLTSRARRPQAG